MNGRWAMSRKRKRMTIDEAINVIHKTIYQFFDGDDGEIMSDKDKLLLAVNKAICNNIKALEKEPPVTPKQTEITLESAIDYLHSIGWLQKHDKEMTESVPTVTEFADKCRECGKQRTGHWIETAEEYYKAVNEYGGGVNEDTPYFVDDTACSVCLAKYSVIDNETERFDYCPSCGARMESGKEQA